jgi:DNA-directed RNA polymerase subunit N (RpoN/RPB10)
VYRATHQGFKALLAIEQSGDSLSPEDNGSNARGDPLPNDMNPSTNDPEYARIKRKINAALRWADVKATAGWAAIILGDTMPGDWFIQSKTPGPKWQWILDALSLYSENLTGTAMEEMVSQLGHLAPISLLKGSGDQEFLAWFDGTLDNQADFGSCGGLTSVSWIAGRIAQLWTHRTNVVPGEKYCFTQMQQNITPLDWPAAGSFAVGEVMECIAADISPSSGEQLLIAPLDRVVEAVIPGLQFETRIWRRCAKCGSKIVCKPMTHRKVHSASSRVEDALHSLQVSFYCCSRNKLIK